MTPAPPPAPAAAEALSLIVFSGDYQRVHYALALASTAAAIGKPVTMLFTGEAIRALARPAADGSPGWRTLAAIGEGGAGRERARNGGEVDDCYRARGVGGLEELLTACAEMGVRIIVCEMGLRVAGLERAALRNDVAFEVAGLVTFLTAASPGTTPAFI